jgi:hypothetical protein
MRRSPWLLDSSSQAPTLITDPLITERAQPERFLAFSPLSAAALFFWLSLGQTNHAITGLKLSAFLQELDSLKPFQHVSLSLDGAGSF